VKEKVIVFGEKTSGWGVIMPGRKDIRGSSNTEIGE
jgi:hypothetical protein